MLTKGDRYFIALLHFGCSKDGDPIEVELPKSGKWLYKDNIEAGCDSLIGSIIEIKGTSDRIVTVPRNSSEFKNGDTLFSDIRADHTQFLGTGYVLTPAGWRKDEAIAVKLYLVVADSKCMLFIQARSVMQSSIGLKSRRC